MIMKHFKLMMMFLTILGLGSMQRLCAQTTVTPAWIENLKNTPESLVGASDDAGIVYLYNVGTGYYLAAGGNWGTEACILKHGDEFAIVKYNDHYVLRATIKAEGGTGYGYVQLMDGVVSGHDIGNYYLDRNEINSDLSEATFTPVAGSSNAYNITYNCTTAEDDAYNGTFYFTSKDRNGAIISVKNDVADAADDPNAQWIFITKKDMIDNFREVAKDASDAQPAEATFVIKDRRFNRNNLEISNWTTGTMNADGTSITWGDALVNSNVDCKPADNAQSTTTTYVYTGRCEGSGFWGHNAHDVRHETTTYHGETWTTSCGRGLVSKEVTLTLSDRIVDTGTKYYVGCGYTQGGKDITKDEDGNTIPSINSQKLYGGLWTANIHGNGVIGQVLTTSTAGWYVVACDGFSTKGIANLYAQVRGNNAANGNEQAQLRQLTDDEIPATYAKAGKLLKEGGWGQHVMVYVPQSLIDEKGGAAEIVIGIKVDDAVDGQWTCVDNFALNYVGGAEEYIVLHEDEQSVDYINAQVDADKSYVMILKRTTPVNQWCSIMLPVDLTAFQFKAAFGDDAKLAELTGVPEDKHYRINFDLVDLRADNSTALKAGKLYIMKPTKEPAEQQATNIPVRGMTDKTIQFAAPYYTIPQVTLKAAVDEGGKVSETKLNDHEDGWIRFVGTYVNSGTEQIVPEGSYVLGSDGKWYHTETVKYTAKGFRAWIEAGPNAQVSLNGVVDGDVTLIEGIETEAKTVANSNVYNMNGQLVRSGSTSLEGLPKGIYIVNHKKYIVK